MKPTDEDYDGMMNVMLRAPFRLCREVIPHLGEGASVVNITSTFAHIGGRRGGAYSAAKGGLKSLTEHMACEYGPRGIRSNCVAPGVTRTEMVAHRFEDEAFKRINVETTPYPRLAEPTDTAAVIAFLCSPGAEMINGQSIVVDGGWTKTKYLSPRVTNTTWIDPEIGGSIRNKGDFAMIRGIHHVGINCRDMARMQKFYGEAFGFTAGR